MIYQCIAMHCIEWINAKLHYFHLSPLHFHMFSQITCLTESIVTLVALVWPFSSVISNEPSDHLSGQMQSHTGCTYSAFLRCAFWNVSSSHLLQRMHSDTDCICLIFLHCAFSNVSSNGLPERMQSHTGCICLTFLQCAFSNVSSNHLLERMHNHTGCIC